MIGIVVLILGLAVGAIIVYRPASRPSPTYQGQSIDYWFTQLPLTSVSSQGVTYVSLVTASPGGIYGSTNKECFDAFDSFGTNAFPYLLEKMASEYSVLEKKASQIAWRVGWKSFPVRNATAERYQATTALLLYIEIPKGTRQTLTNLTKSPNPEIADSAKFVLRESRGFKPGWMR
jgi:hypothetical protein